MKNLILFLMIAVSCSYAAKAQNKTQAYLGKKTGGEWIWVTKEGGKQQYEYKGGVFEPVKSLKVDAKHTECIMNRKIAGITLIYRDLKLLY